MKQREEKKLEREGETGRRCRTVGKLKLFLHLKWKHSDTEAVSRTRDDDSFSVIVLHEARHVSPSLVNVDTFNALPVSANSMLKTGIAR